MSDRDTFAAEDAFKAGEEAAEANSAAEEDLVQSPEDVTGHIPAEKLDAILEEIAGYEVELEEDPTLPHLGLRYLQSRIAQCRQYLNRTQYYLQITKRYEKNLKRASKVFELDLELKLAGLLADDPIVRKQSAIEDRKALAISMLKKEHEVLARFRVEVQNLDDTIRLVKARYDDLRHTNGDIKLQRQLVKDEMSGLAEGGYAPPQSREDKTIPGGLPPPVRPSSISPDDLLDPDKRPDDLPEPKSPSHARQIANFFGNKPVRDAAPEPRDAASEAPPEEPEEPEEPARAVRSMSYEDLLK